MDNHDLDQIREAILEIRETGCCNMLDTAAVQRAAHEMNFFELVVFIEEHKRNYTNFIFYGEFK